MSSVMSNQTGFNRSSFVFTAGIAGVVGFVGYALYFDHKRRSDPNYKQNIRQNRKMKQKSRTTGSSSSIPDPRNAQAMQQYFFDEMTLGEELMNNGNLEEGVFHMSNAVFACEHPAELIQIFQQTLPALQFEALAQALPEAKIRHTTALRCHQIADAAIENADSEVPSSQQAIIVDDDLE